MNEVNIRIAKCRNEAGLTQRELAKKLGIKGSTYSQMERVGKITCERLFKTAEILGTTPCYLYGGKEPCKEIITPKNDTTLIFQQPEAEKPKKEIFVIKRKEERMLKLMRNLSKEDREKIEEFIDQIYKESKK